MPMDVLTWRKRIARRDQASSCNPFPMSHHRHRRPEFEVVVPDPDRVRTLRGIAFGWIDAALHHRGWLRVLSPQSLAVYAFLCLVADHRGVSFYRRDRIARELGLDDHEVVAALTRLRELDLIAFRPFRPGAVDGFHQVLSLPESAPAPLLPDQLIGDLTARLRSHA